MKVYTSKEGLRFGISVTPKPAEGDVVFFTGEEFDWIKKQGFNAAEFKFCWESKKENHLWSPIPEVTKHLKNEMAVRYSNEIINSLKGKQAVEPEEDSFTALEF